MANITITGNLTNDPDLRFTPSGAAVANLTVAENTRVRKDGEWTDGPTNYYRVSVWRTMGENVANGLRKGARVIVTGELKERQYETTEGEKRSAWEITADDVGASLKFSDVQLSKGVERVKESEPVF